jgi:hypothetical protein
MQFYAHPENFTQLYAHFTQSLYAAKLLPTPLRKVRVKCFTHTLRALYAYGNLLMAEDFVFTGAGHVYPHLDGMHGVHWGARLSKLE